MTDQIQNYIQDYFQMVREGLINPERHIDTFEMSDYLRQKYSLKASDHAVSYIFLRDWKNTCFLVPCNYVGREVHEWIRDNLVGIWGGPYVDASFGNILENPVDNFAFEQEIDAVHFRLRWG